eukprot:14695449-Ditylum_brightwellii.AAC.1
MAREQNKSPKPDAVPSSADKKRAPIANAKFQGRSDDLKGCIFDTDTHNIGRFSIVQEEIAQYVGANYDHGDLIAKAIRTLQTPANDQPDDPGEDPNYYTETLFKEAVKDYVRDSKIPREMSKRVMNWYGDRRQKHCKRNYAGIQTSPILMKKEM